MVLGFRNLGGQNSLEWFVSSKTCAWFWMVLGYVMSFLIIKLVASALKHVFVGDYLPNICCWFNRWINDKWKWWIKTIMIVVSWDLGAPTKYIWDRLGLLGVNWPPTTTDIWGNLNHQLLGRYVWGDWRRLVIQPWDFTKSDSNRTTSS